MLTFCCILLTSTIGLFITVASIVGGKLNLCMVRDKKGFMGECGIDADKLYIQTLVYPNSLTCDSTDIPEIGHFVHYGCTGSGSAIPNTYSKSDCTNSTAEQVVGSVKGLSFK